MKSAEAGSTLGVWLDFAAHRGGTLHLKDLERVTTNGRCAGGQFVVHIVALHGNPYAGHTLKAAVEIDQALDRGHGATDLRRQGYRGHGLDRFKVWRSDPITR